MDVVTGLTKELTYYLQNIHHIESKQTLTDVLSLVETIKRTLVPQNPDMQDLCREVEQLAFDKLSAESMERWKSIARLVWLECDSCTYIKRALLVSENGLGRRVICGCRLCSAPIRQAIDINLH